MRFLQYTKLHLSSAHWAKIAVLCIGLTLFGCSAAPATPAAKTPTASGAVAQANTPDAFVVNWLLFGTPTITPTQNPTDKAIWATIIAGTPTEVPTVLGATAAPKAQATAAPVSSGGLVTQAPGTIIVGDAQKGRQLFNGMPACFTCHDTSAGIVIVGPSLKGVSVRADTNQDNRLTKRKIDPAQQDRVVQYLYSAITNPGGYVLPNFQDLMPKNFPQILTKQQIGDLIAYLLTLK